VSLLNISITTPVKKKFRHSIGVRMDCSDRRHTQLTSGTGSLTNFCCNLVYINYEACGPGSSFGIATGYGLDGPGIESRWGARFSAPVQTGPGAHQASCTMGTGSFPGVKSGRSVTLAPSPPSSGVVKKE